MFCICLFQHWSFFIGCSMPSHINILDHYIHVRCIKWCTSNSPWSTSPEQTLCQRHPTPATPLIWFSQFRSFTGLKPHYHTHPTHSWTRAFLYWQLFKKCDCSFFFNSKVYCASIVWCPRLRPKFTDFTIKVGYFTTKVNTSLERSGSPLEVKPEIDFFGHRGAWRIITAGCVNKLYARYCICQCYIYSLFKKISYCRFTDTASRRLA